jgi:hypothetical protein
MGINAANNAPITKAYNPGIIQSWSQLIF